MFTINLRLFSVLVWMFIDSNAKQISLQCVNKKLMVTRNIFLLFYIYTKTQTLENSLPTTFFTFIYEVSTNDRFFWNMLFERKQANMIDYISNNNSQ